MDVQRLLEGLRQRESRALARALSVVENRAPEARELLEAVFRSTSRSNAVVVGLTGPAGVGKSTLADVLARKARERGREVAILAIDPTSPVTGGALLGDRARMDAGTKDPTIFIRSMATRGHVGGLASAAFEALVLLEAAGKDFILLETVGAGQDEVEVAAAVDVTVLVLAPGLGDELQAAKAGILEVADVLVVNKRDREGADALFDELHSIAGTRPVRKVSALDGTGVDELLGDALAFTSARREPEASHRYRRLMEVWLGDVLATLVRDRIPEAAWASAVTDLEERRLTPYQAAEGLLSRIAEKKS